MSRRKALDRDKRSLSPDFLLPLSLPLGTPGGLDDCRPPLPLPPPDGLSPERPLPPLRPLAPPLPLGRFPDRPLPLPLLPLGLLLLGDAAASGIVF